MWVVSIKALIINIYQIYQGKTLKNKDRIGFDELLWKCSQTETGIVLLYPSTVTEIVIPLLLHKFAAIETFGFDSYIEMVKATVFNFALHSGLNCFKPLK